MKTLAVDPGANMSALVHGLDDEIYAVHYEAIGDQAWPQYFDEVVVEKPQIYVKSKGDPNDLINVALAAGYWTGLGSKVFTLLPNQWKGTVPKAICQARIEKKLTSKELAIVTKLTKKLGKTKAHNVWDAVGIYLFHVGRARRGMT